MQIDYDMPMLMVLHWYLDVCIYIYVKQLYTRHMDIQEDTYEQ